MTGMFEEFNASIRQLERALSLLSEFPPEEQAINIKLRALALEVEVMDAIHRASIQQHDVALSSFKHIYLHEMNKTQKNLNERVDEFSRVYVLVRDFLPRVPLLPTWRDYVKEYHELMATKHSPRGEE